MTAQTSSIDPSAPVTRLEYDPFDGREIPYPFYAQARQQRPVFFSEVLNAYVVTRYEDCDQILRDDGTTFSANAALEPNVELSAAAAGELLAHGFVPGPGEGVVDEDPPIARPHRQAIQGPFRPKQIHALEEFVRRAVTSRLDQIVQRGHAEMVEALFYEVPAVTILHLMGVPESELGIVRVFGRHWAVFGWGLPTGHQQVETARGMGEYWSWARDYVHRLLDEPGDDIISHAIRELKAQDNFDVNWVIRWALNAVMAGHETTTNASASALRSLLLRREQWERLCAEPNLIENAMAECLRFDTSVPTWRQRAVRDVEVGGVLIPAGAKVYVALCSAGHDETIFGGDAEELDVARPNAKRHLAFGSGRHTCLGNHLANLEMRVMFEELTRRLPHMRLRDDQHFSWSPNSSQRGPETVHVVWDVATNPQY